MLTQHIALVPEAGGVSASDLSRVCAALQKQVTRDFAPIWSISATVDAFPQLEEVPIGYWPIILSADALGRAAGIHHDDNGQPYAQLELGRDWSLTASRVCMEMLVNATGERTVSGPSLRSDQGVVEFLIEVCGTCANPEQSYLIHDVLVSDFCTPSFFAAAAHGDRRRYSFYGSLTAPLELPPGGHLAWYEPISSSWWVRSFWEHNPVDTELGSLDGRDLCARELVRQLAPLEIRGGTQRTHMRDVRASSQHHRVLQASQHRARRLRALLAQHAEPRPAETARKRVVDLSGAFAAQTLCDEDEATNLWPGARSVELELELEEQDIEQVREVMADEVVDDFQQEARQPLEEEVVVPEPRAYLQRRVQTHPPPRRTPPPFMQSSGQRQIKTPTTMKAWPPRVIDAPVELPDSVDAAPAPTPAAASARSQSAPPPPPLSFFPVSGSLAPAAPHSIKGTSWFPVAALAIASSLAFVWISRSSAVPAERQERPLAAAPTPVAVPGPAAHVAPTPNVTPIVSPVGPPAEHAATTTPAEPPHTASEASGPTASATRLASSTAPKTKRAARPREALSEPVVSTSDLPARAKRGRAASKDAELFSPLPPNPFGGSDADESVAELLDTRR